MKQELTLPSGTSLTLRHSCDEDMDKLLAGQSVEGKPSVRRGRGLCRRISSIRNQTWQDIGILATARYMYHADIVCFYITSLVAGDMGRLVIALRQGCNINSWGILYGTILDKAVGVSDTVCCPS
jgi:hypothetical protein